MSNSFTLAEFPGDVKALASVMRPQERRLAVTPTAMEELDGWGLPYLIDGDVCTAEELNRIGLDNFSRAEGLVDAYDRAIFDQSPTIRQVGLRPFRGHFTRVKFLLDAVTTRLNILHRLIGDGVEQVYKTLPQGPRPPTDSNLFYGADASLYGELLELLATQAGVPVTWVSRPAVPPAQSGLRLRPWAAVRRLEEFGRGVTTAFRVPRSNGTRPRRILLLSTAYDMGSVAAEYRTQGADVFWLDLSQPRLYRCPGRWPYRVSCPSTEVHSVQEEVRRLTLFQPGDAAEELCRDDGLSYAPLVRRALGLYLDHTFPRAVALRAFLEACHRKLDFDLVLSHCGPHTVETSAVFDFCHKVGVPVAVLQHGGYGVCG